MRLWHVSSSRYANDNHTPRRRFDAMEGSRTSCRRCTQIHQIRHLCVCYGDVRGKPHITLAAFHANSTSFQVLGSGQIPFKGLDDVQVVVALLTGKRPPCEPLCSATGASFEPLWEIARACWHTEPNRRPDISVVAENLAFACHEPSRADDESRVSSPRPNVSIPKAPPQVHVSTLVTQHFSTLR